MDTDKNNYVWYVCYGSNMLRERFLCYIKGGRYREFNRPLTPCSDTSEPIQCMPYILPYDMYYAKHSGSWKNSAVSFLDVTKPGQAYGVAYLITKEQFDHVCRQENNGNKPEDAAWYNAVVALGTWDGIPVETLTNSRRLEEAAPGKEYLEVLSAGILENYKYLRRSEAIDYTEKFCTRTR